MRAAWIGLLLVTVALAGCTEEPLLEPLTPEPGQKYGEILAEDDPLSAYTWQGTNLIFDALDPPTVAPGTAWTYAMAGAWALTDEIQVIATPGTSGGYVFGAHSISQLQNAAIWGDHWFGPMDAGLNPLGSTEVLFDWPLHDGQMFASGGRIMMVVADIVDTPLGQFPGYQIEGRSEHHLMSYGYVPEIGYLTSFTYGPADGSTPWITLELRSVGQAESATWFEKGPRFMLGTTANPFFDDGPNVTLEVYEVPDGYDHLIIAGLGTNGAGASARLIADIPNLAIAPPQAAYTFEDANGFWDWQTAMLPAYPGIWLLETHTLGEGWAYFEGAPVKWITLEL